MMSLDGFVSAADGGHIHEYHLAIHPVALGSGLQIFYDLKIPVYLKLADVKTFPKGAIAMT